MKNLSKFVPYHCQTVVIKLIFLYFVVCSVKYFLEYYKTLSENSSGVFTYSDMAFLPISCLLRSIL